MGTRGLIGFHLDGKDYLAYNHYDSYPSGLGVDVVKQIKNMNLDSLPEQVRQIRLIDPSSTSTQEDITQCAQYTNLSVSRESTNDWYYLLREAQGNLQAYLDLGIMPDDHVFILDSGFCEWAYIVNLDSMELEVWKGFQKLPDHNSRYSANPNRYKYYPCKLIAARPLVAVDGEFMKAIED